MSEKKHRASKRACAHTWLASTMKITTKTNFLRQEQHPQLEQHLIINESSKNHIYIYDDKQYITDNVGQSIRNTRLNEQVFKHISSRTVKMYDIT